MDQNDSSAEGRSRAWAITAAGVIRPGRGGPAARARIWAGVSVFRGGSGGGRPGEAGTGAERPGPARGPAGGPESSSAASDATSNRFTTFIRHPLVARRAPGTRRVETRRNAASPTFARQSAVFPLILR